MEKDRMNRNMTARSRKEWEALVERYFDAETTEKEERELRRFLATSEAGGAVFDEARAVMGFLSVGRSVHTGKSHSGSWTKAWQVVAVVGGLAIGTAFWSQSGGSDVCEAYVYGKKYTEVALVMEHVRKSIEQVDVAGEADVVERQLEDIFSVMDGNMENE